MNAAAGVAAAVLVITVSQAAAEPRLAGAWVGDMTHEGEVQPIGLELEPVEDGRLLLKVTLPAIHLSHTPLGKVKPEISGNDVKLGPFAFTYDPRTDTLVGAMPEAFVPVYRIPMALRRADKVALPERAAPTGAPATPVWTFDAGAPLWPGATFADGVVYAAGDDGRVHALEARTGKARWAFTAGGRVRSRVTAAGDVVYFQADDGYLYKLVAATGALVYRVQVAAKPAERLPFDNPKSRYDRFASDVLVADGRVYVGTHDGTLLALEPAHGTTVFAFAADDSILAAPAVSGGRAYFGSYDGHVYAVDARTGVLAWRRDTRKPVVSTPAPDGGLVVVGNRAYDLLGLDAATGEVAWKRYVWNSWVESSASVRDGVAYVGSSDAAYVAAVQTKDGRERWRADVHGWAWGQPAVTPARVYAGVASQVGYLAAHRAGLVALDRATGQAVWRYAIPAPPSGPYGFPGSPAAGAGLVFATGLDGKVYAFAE
jgi:outer membrane protein assembly factor BamB